MRLRADRRLFLTYLALILLVLVPLSLGAERLVRRHLSQMVEGDLWRELALAAELHDALAGAPPDSVADALGRLSGRRVTIIAPGGRVLGESDPVAGGPAAMENHGTRPEVLEALRGGAGRSVRRSSTVGVAHLYVARATERGVVLRLAVRLSDVDAAMDRVQRGIVAVGAVALLLAALFSLGFSVLVTRPLRQVLVLARAMAAGDLSRRLRLTRDDELGDVARAVDLLADQLQRRLGQLEDERAEMQALIDSMAEAVLALAPDGSLRRANPAARALFNLPASYHGIAPEAVVRRPEFLRLVARALGGEAVSPVEFSVGPLALLGSGHPLPDGGAVLVFLNVSELRRLEGVRRDFVANASHELKTPLTVIRGYSETLLDPALPPELVRRFSDTVKQNADRLQRIVDDLLDLSRIESGGWRVEPEVLEVEAVAREAWAAQGDAARAREVAFHVEVDPAARLALADAAAIHQVFTNLYSNAIRYTPPGGGITVRIRPGAPPRDTALRQRVPHGARGWIAVEVEDSGTGIPSAHLPRIFERFYRVDPARSRAEGGTGLGLAIVRHLVEAHGGQIDAHSEVGRGTRIRFTLPAAPRPRP